jgi:hypothetical protein
MLSIQRTYGSIAGQTCNLALDKQRNRLLAADVLDLPEYQQNKSDRISEVIAQIESSASGTDVFSLGLLQNLQTCLERLQNAELSMRSNSAFTRSMTHSLRSQRSSTIGGSNLYRTPHSVSLARQSSSVYDDLLSSESRAGTRIGGSLLAPPPEVRQSGLCIRNPRPIAPQLSQYLHLLQRQVVPQSQPQSQPQSSQNLPSQLRQQSQPSLISMAVNAPPLVDAVGADGLTPTPSSDVLPTVATVVESGAALLGADSLAVAAPAAAAAPAVATAAAAAAAAAAELADPADPAALLVEAGAGDEIDSSFNSFSFWNIRLLADVSEEDLC